MLGPLATYAEPHCYDLCAEHSDRMTAPRGWEIVRLAPDPDALLPTSDDLLALADAVREAGVPAMVPTAAGSEGGSSAASDGRELGRRGHLRVLPPPTS